ncbi:MAG: DUF3667 domain-containing protein [Pseudomonadota bacterium]|nr:DUF3667 domain-containing protein [Pseudomonadota bacterium]
MDILDDDGDGDSLLPIAAGAATATGAALACLSCGATLAGAYCHDCGQKNDDLRRSSLRLARDFVEDTFAFDSRMWRTLALMAAKPGVVPTDYAHGRRSRYTPPVRLFLVVSFLFFLTLGLTETMFVAMEVREATLKETAIAEKTAKAANISVGVDADNEENGLDCNITAGLRFFVRPKDLALDSDAWRRCYTDVEKTVAEAIIAPDEDGEAIPEPEAEKTLGFVSGVLAGISGAIENPKAFNADINTWLPRVMFVMTPVLALILALFIRGRNALMFDHLVLSLYTHAVGFAVIGVAIIAVQLGLRAAFPVALLAFAVYFMLALKRAYGRGWVKTIWTGVMSGLLYMMILISIVLTIVVKTLVA